MENLSGGAVVQSSTFEDIFNDKNKLDNTKDYAKIQNSGAKTALDSNNEDESGTQSDSQEELLPNLSEENQYQQNITKELSANDTSQTPKDIIIKLIRFARKINSKDYKEGKEKIENDIKSLDDANKNWKILTVSSDTAETNKFAYKSAVFINHEAKKIHIATAGTRISAPFDILDDLLLLLGLIPLKIHPTKNLINKILEQVPQIHEYTFETSGHSLGAVVSDLTAGEIISRGLKFSMSTTFDNPGSKHSVKRALKLKKFSGDNINLKLSDIASKAQVYNARPNLINTAAKQLAKDVYFVSSAGKHTELDELSGIDLEIAKIGKQHNLKFFKRKGENTYKTKNKWGSEQLFIQGNKDLLEKQNTGREVVVEIDDQDDDCVFLVGTEHKNL